MKLVFILMKIGETWGIKGFAKMIRDKENNCGIATDSSFPYL